MVLSKITGGMVMGMTLMSKSPKSSNVFWAVSFLITYSSINRCHCNLCIFHCELCNRIDCLKKKWFCFFTGKSKFRQDLEELFYQIETSVKLAAIRHISINAPAIPVYRWLITALSWVDCCILKCSCNRV